MFPYWPPVAQLVEHRYILSGGRAFKLHRDLIFLDPWGLPNFLNQGNVPRGFGVSAVLPTSGTQNILKICISVSRVLCGSTPISIPQYTLPSTPLKSFSYCDQITFNEPVLKPVNMNLPGDGVVRGQNKTEITGSPHIRIEYK